MTEEGVRWPSRHFLREPLPLADDDGRTALLGCRCGETACWPFSARVEVGNKTVTWSDYRHGHRDWDYRELRAFTFERAQYEDAVRATVLEPPARRR